MANNTTYREYYKLKEDGQKPQDPYEGLHNVSGEKSLLGAVLYDSNIFDEIENIVNPGHFFDSTTKTVFELFIKALKNSSVVRPVHIVAHLAQELRVDGDRASEILRNMVAGKDCLGHVETARQIRDFSDKRALVDLCDRMRAQAKNASTSSIDCLDAAEKALFDLRKVGKADTVLSVHDAVDIALQQSYDAYQTGTGLSGISSGYRWIDSMTGGLSPEDYFVIGARPSMGKTMLSSWMAMNMAKNGTGVAYFTLETSSVSLGRRALSSLSGISANDIKIGNMTEEQFVQCGRIKQDLKQYPLYFDAPTRFTPSKLLTNMRRFIRERECKIAFVDYVQLMKPDERTRGRYEEITSISADFRNVLRELGVPIVFLAQLNREAAKRSGGSRKPELHDLKESGQIEQDANVVLLLHREEAYLAKEEPQFYTGKDVEERKRSEAAYARWEAAMERERGKVDIIIAKNKDGATGSVKMHFDGKGMKFVEEAFEYSQAA
jgi:replicative DNA helicase